MPLKAPPQAPRGFFARVLTNLKWHLRRRSGWRPVHPADDPDRPKRKPGGGPMSSQPEMTSLGSVLVLLTIPKANLQRRLAFCGDVGQAATTFYVQAYGQESDFTVRYDGSYLLSDTTKASLRSKHLYLRTTDSAIVITDRQLPSDRTYSYVGHPDTFYYGKGLCAMLAWHPLTLYEGITNPDGTETIADVLDNFFRADQAPPLRRKSKKAIMDPRMSDATFEAEFQRVASELAVKRKEISQITEAMLDVQAGRPIKPEPHQASSRYSHRAARDPDAHPERLHTRGIGFDEAPHLRIVFEGAGEWNRWRRANSHITPNLRRAELLGLNLAQYDFSSADLTDARLTGAFLYATTFVGANLTGADLRECTLSNADLTRANLTEAVLEAAAIGSSTVMNEAVLENANLRCAQFLGSQLVHANLRNANLLEARASGADLRFSDLSTATLDRADFSHADLSHTTLTGARLNSTILTEANLEHANLSGAFVYGVSAWNVRLTGTTQTDLVVTSDEEAVITVDNLEVAEFIYKLLTNEKIRGVIDTLSSKVVLILGRFTPARKHVLKTLKDALRHRNFVPVLFDFEKPRSRTTLETVVAIAQMSQFVVADLTDASSVLQELQAIVPSNPSVPVQPLLQASQNEPGMFDFFRRYPWVLTIHRYSSADELELHLDQRVLRRVADYVQNQPNRRSS